MTQVKFYGGPAHGRIEDIQDGCHQIHVPVSRFTRIEYVPRELTMSEMLREPTWENETYYIQRYHQRGVSFAGNQFYRHIAVAMWERGELTVRDQYEVESDIRRVEWILEKEPSILYDFDQWWEKQLHEIGWKPFDIYGG